MPISKEGNLKVNLVLMSEIHIMCTEVTYTVSHKGLMGLHLQWCSGIGFCLPCHNELSPLQQVYS